MNAENTYTYLKNASGWVVELILEKDNELWKVILVDNQNSRKFKQLLDKKKSNTKIELIRTNYCLYKTYRAKIDKFSKLNKYRSEQIRKNLQKETKKDNDIKTFHETLNSLGLKFQIDFCPYKEDIDRMRVTQNGIVIFNGSTEDLPNRGK